MNSNDTLSRNQRIALWSTLFVVGCLIAYWAFFEREHTEWDQVLRLWDGRRLEVHQYNSQRVYHGGHGFGWGGGDPWGGVTFAINGTTYQWDEKYIPIAIQVDQSGVYIVVFDRETTDSHGFRIYRATSPSGWDEIRPADFPRHLAIQNTWLRENNGVGRDGKVLNEFELVAQMDPGLFWFRDSLTAKLWSYLEDPASFNFHETPTEDFVRQFKAKWVNVASNEQPQGAVVPHQPGG